MIINKSGITLRLKLATVKLQGRVTQGVRLINLTKRNDCISNVCVVDSQEDDEESIETVVPETNIENPEVETN